MVFRLLKIKHFKSLGRLNFLWPGRFLSCDAGSEVGCLILSRYYVFLHLLWKEIHFSIFQGKFKFDDIAIFQNLNIEYGDVYIEQRGYLIGKLHFQKFELFYFRIVFKIQYILTPMNAENILIT